MENKRYNYDVHWKVLIKDLFEEFVQYFLPQLYHRIDFTIAPVFLQQELEQIIQDESSEGKMINDKLVRVKLKNGEDRYILIHIEIQSSSDKHFSLRMFKYFYRIFDTYLGEDITAIAVYTGKWRPKIHDRYLKQEDGIGITYVYHSYWVEEANKEALKASKNPFALAVLAAKNLNDTKKDPDLRVNYKLELISLMKDRQYTPQQMRALLTFIQLMLILPEKQNLEFKKKFKALYVKKTTMHPQDAKSILDLANILFEVGGGTTIENLLQQTKIDSAKEFLKAGVAIEVVAFSLKLPLEKILEIQAQLKLGQA